MNNFLKILFVFVVFHFAVYGQSHIQNQNSNEVRFLAAGDLNLAHWLTKIIEKEGNDYPFKYLKRQLFSADLVFCNLELHFVKRVYLTQRILFLKCPKIMFKY